MSPVRVTPDPLAEIVDYTFSPDGRALAIAATTGGHQQILIASTDGSRIRQVEGMATNAAWRPPDGSEILFMDPGDDANGYGAIHVMSADGSEVRTILERTPGRFRGFPSWSPDGSQIYYVEWGGVTSDITAQTHIIAADGTGDRVLPMPPGAVWQAAAAWSNDAKRLVAIRGYTGGYDGSRAVVMPADGSGFGIEIAGFSPAAECCAGWEWAPDDSRILVTPTVSSGAFVDQVLLDPVAGTYGTPLWQSVSEPSWQRLAR
jgi:hypothetical protein